MIPESFIQDLLARVDITDVVGQYVQLRKGGANLLGLCPFHNEKSPSFTVSPTKQFYHCFGCGVHGSAITFLMEHTGASFPEAVRTLSGSVGLSVPEESRGPGQQAADKRRKEAASRHTQVLDAAHAHYLRQLRAAPKTIAYLKERGLTGEIAAQFGLGWSGTDRQGLAKVFDRYEDPLLVESGLVIESEDGRRYDRFRERVMFPIRNARGTLIGFGGRIIGQGEPKYLNSPETPVFSKGQELYGLWEARNAIRQAGHVIVVEGYMDVVGLAQQGVGNAVATLGTATTPDHIKKLIRTSDRIIFSFDGDKAGRRAAWRALQACLPALRDDLAIRFLFLPEEHDPDSYVRGLGADAFRACVGQAQALSRFLLEELASRHNLTEPEGRASCLHEAKPLLAQIPECSLGLQIERELARLVQLTPEEIERVLAQEPKPAAPLMPAGPSRSSLAVNPPGSAARHGGSTSSNEPDDGYFDSFPPVVFDTGPAYPDQDGGRPGKGRPREKRGGFRRNGNDRARSPGAFEPRRSVPTLAKRLLRLLLAHPELVDSMGDQQLEVLDYGAHLEMVRELIVLIQFSGGRHIGALIQAAEPDSDLALLLRSMGKEVLAEEDLPHPQTEWDDALRRIEFDAVRAEMSALADGGLAEQGSRDRYHELSQRMAVLKRASDL